MKPGVWRRVLVLAFVASMTVNMYMEGGLQDALWALTFMLFFWMMTELD
jgi:hypothetical protein